MATKKENLQLKKEELKAKYGNTIVMGVPEALVSPLLTKIYTPKEGLYVAREGGNGITQVPLLNAINAEMQPMLRCEAELDPGFKQVIPYVVLRYQDKVFCTHRLNGGDARLAGGYSIGTGGHIDNSESVYDGMYRELKEEVGVTDSVIMGYSVNGFILDNSSAVNSVHLGIVISMVITTDEIKCLETEKLTGEWMNYKQLKKLYDEDKLESWSKIVADNLLFGGDTNGKRNKKEKA